MSPDDPDLTPDSPADPEDARLLDELRGLWEAADPVPEGLIERVITDLAMADLDSDIEMLRLLEQATPAGTRTATGAESVSRFGADGATLLLHLTGAGERRLLVGWIDPPQRAVVSLVTPTGATEVAADESGRFEFEARPGDRARIVLALDGGRLATHVMEF